jgi:hypothetical protein
MPLEILNSNAFLHIWQQSAKCDSSRSSSGTFYRTINHSFIAEFFCINNFIFLDTCYTLYFLSIAILDEFATKSSQGSVVFIICLSVCPPVTTLEPLLSLSFMLRPTVSRPVCLGIKHPSGAYDQIFSVRKTEYV